METTDVLSLVEMIQTASWASLLLIIALVLPVYLATWGYLRKQINFSPKQNLRFDVAVSIVLVGFILITKIGQSETDQRIIASKQIKNYMQQRSWTLMGFNRIRSNINESYSNSFLYKVVEDFPTDFAKVTLTDTSDQYGLKLITSDPSMAEFETASHKVTNYLFALDTTYRVIHFNAIRKDVDTRYSDDFLEELIERFPHHFQRTTVKMDTSDVKMPAILLIDKEHPDENVHEN